MCIIMTIMTKKKTENIKEKIFDLDVKYPDISISYNYTY